ncbi:50S ribosome-binding GTPase [bacterium]|nr:50S ribosome-binding GTPase [bacterium]
MSSPNLKGCVSHDFKEFALLGRSNVGKSTFINTLCNHSKLAKTSNTPGKTRLINLFEIICDTNSFVIADLPGYGFAKVSKKEQIQ